MRSGLLLTSGSERLLVHGIGVALREKSSEKLKATNRSQNKLRDGKGELHWEGAIRALESHNLRSKHKLEPAGGLWKLPDWQGRWQRYLGLKVWSWLSQEVSVRLASAQ